MIPFSLEEYYKNPKVPLITRDGRPARIVSTNGFSDDYPIYYIVVQKDGTEVIGACDIHGLTGYKPMNHDIFINNDNELKPFDKVLVRDSNTDEWRPTFYWKVKPIDGKLRFYTTGGGYCNQCIPYNTETAKLISTTNMPHEKYRVW